MDRPTWAALLLSPVPSARPAWSTHRAGPDACPNGHPLGPDRVLAGNRPCIQRAGTSHRIWMCKQCYACWVWSAGAPWTLGPSGEARNRCDLGIVSGSTV